MSEHLDSSEIDSEPEDGALLSENDSEDRELQRRKYNAFILDEAEDDDVDEELDELDPDESEEGFSQLVESVEKKKPRLDIQEANYKQSRTESYIEKLTQKYGAVDSDDEDDELEDFDNIMEHDDATTIQHSRLPTISDPKMWLFGCLRGEERRALYLMVRKFIMKQKELELDYTSIVFKDNLPGKLYIEAPVKSNTLQAIDGIHMCDMFRYKQKLVPLNEMPHVLNVVQLHSDIKRNTWVRIKTGKFAGDLGVVLFNEVQDMKVNVKLMPRIDYKKLEEKNKPGYIQTKTKRPRAPQTLFDMDAVSTLGGIVKTSGNFFIFEGNRYNSDGFLNKWFPSKVVDNESIEPTIEEYNKFKDNDDEATEDVPESKVKSVALIVGEAVIVTQGDCKNVTGLVTRIQGDLIYIKPYNESLGDCLDFESIILKRFFKRTDHVKVISGPFENETGNIVDITDNVVKIVTDLGQRELVLLDSQVRLYSGKSTGVDATSKIVYGDVVLFGASAAGIVVQIEKQYVTVVTLRGEKRVNIESVEKFVPKRGNYGQDANKVRFVPRDKVRVIKGADVGFQGIVKCILNHQVFIKGSERSDSRNVLIVPTSSVELKGTSCGTKRLESIKPKFDNLKKKESTINVDRKRVERLKNKNKLRGQRVKVVMGPYKGNTGYVREVAGEELRIDLDVNCKTISIKTDKIRFINDDLTFADQHTSYERQFKDTPVYIQQTPLYSSNTPCHGSFTPNAGGSTPMAGAMTPAWDPSSLATPRHDQDFDTRKESVLEKAHEADEYVDLDDWTEEGLYVKVLSSCSDKSLVGQNALIVKKEGKILTCQFDTLGDVLSLPEDVLVPILPQLYDRVCFITGRQKGLRMKVISFDMANIVCQKSDDPENVCMDRQKNACKCL